MKISMYFPFNEDSDNKIFSKTNGDNKFSDLSYYIRKGTYLAFGENTYSFETGLLGKSLYLQKGSSGYLRNIDTYYTSTIVPKECSYGMWIKIDKLPTSERTLVYFSSGQDNTYANGYYYHPGNYFISISNKGILSAKILYWKSGTGFTNSQTGNSNPYVYTTYKVSSSENAIQINRWYHLAFTFGNDCISLFIDGIKVASKEIITDKHILYSSNQTSNLKIGDANAEGGIYYSELMVGDKRWTDEEIQELAEPLLVHYSLRQNKYPLIYDSNTKTYPIPITDCKLSQNKKNIVINANSNGGYKIINIENTSLTGRNRGSAVFTEGGTYKNFFNRYNLDHKNISFSLWYNFDIYADSTAGDIFSFEMSNYIIRLTQENSSWKITAYTRSSYSNWWSGSVSGGPYDAKRLNTKIQANYDTYRLLTFTYDGSTFKFYLDDELKWSKTCVDAIHGNLNICCFPYGNLSKGPGPARIGDFKIYAKTLTIDEIQEIYNKEDIKIAKNGKIEAGEFIETNTSILHPKGVIYCNEIQEDTSIEGIELTSDGILKAKEFIER